MDRMVCWEIYIIIIIIIINGNPGISQAALAAIQKRISSGQEKPIVGLIFDEMSIRKHIDFDGNRNIGFVDFGIDLPIDSENFPLASQVLMYMVVCWNGSWKVPISYNFIDSLQLWRAWLPFRCQLYH
jgi:hypothetical protein